MNENEERLIQRDRMRFIKNSLSANLAILAIVFNVLYFVSIYRSNVGTFYYNYLMGISVVYNLIFMLATFLSSEGVKNYKKNYSYLLVALGIGQIIRIFILPAKAHGAIVAVGDAMTTVMGDKQYVSLLVYLIISAVCLIAAAVTNNIKCSMLEAHMKTLTEESV